MYTFQDKKMKQTFPSNSARNSALTGKTPSIASSRSVNSSVLMQSVQQGFEQQSSSNQAFQAFPNQIVFQDFEAPGNYQECISFRNNDNVSSCRQFLPLQVSRRISVSAPKSRFFRVEPVKKNTSNTLVAPGLDVSFNIFFSPDEKIDYSCDLVVKTEQEEFTIPIVAIGLRGMWNYSYWLLILIQLFLTFRQALFLMTHL